MTSELSPIWQVTIISPDSLCTQPLWDTEVNFVFVVVHKTGNRPSLAEYAHLVRLEYTVLSQGGWWLRNRAVSEELTARLAGSRSSTLKVHLHSTSAVFFPVPLHLFSTGSQASDVPFRDLLTMVPQPAEIRFLNDTTGIAVFVARSRAVEGIEQFKQSESLDWLENLLPARNMTDKWREVLTRLGLTKTLHELRQQIQIRFATRAEWVQRTLRRTLQHILSARFPLTASVMVTMSGIVLAETEFAFAFSDMGGEQLQSLTTDTHRTIFASYAVEDLEVVECVDGILRALGAGELRWDLKVLLSGDTRRTRIETEIERADIFQLFWSAHARSSGRVRQELEYAVGLNRPGFIRPIYWQDPLGTLPAELKDIRFARVTLPLRPRAGAGAANEAGSSPQWRCLVAFAPSDRRFFNRLMTHLRAIPSSHSVKFWDPTQVRPGLERNSEIEKQLVDSHVVVVLVSADLLADHESLGIARQALSRAERTGVRLIPVLVRPCNLQSSIFQGLAPLPSDRRPISLRKDRESALADIATIVMQTIADIPT